MATQNNATEQAQEIIQLIDKLLEQEHTPEVSLVLRLAANTIKNQNIDIKNMQLQLNALNRAVFGSKREATAKTNLTEGIQSSLFEEPDTEEQNQKSDEETETVIVHKKKKSKSKAFGIKEAELNNVEIETIQCELEGDDIICADCGAKMIPIGQEVIRQEIVYVPAKLKIKKYISTAYKCPKCGTQESENEKSNIQKAEVPKAILPHSQASPSLIANVIFQKYYMGVPLYRQEKVWDDLGLMLPRNNMAHWCIKVYEYYLKPLYDLMAKRMKELNKLTHVDETTIQCNKEPGRKADSKSYMWVMVSGELENTKGVVFMYSPHRDGEVAIEFLKGFDGIIVTDGYAGYNDVKCKMRAKCWAHCRRYFYESIPLDKKKQMITSSDGYTGVKYIDQLFKIEREINQLNPEDKLKERLKRSEPIFKNFYEWVDLTSQKIIVNRKLEKAIHYAQNQKEGLEMFLKDGRIPLSNNRGERSIRMFAVHRKNWLFADTMVGAKANAVYYSLIESAKVNQLNISRYISYLLTELPQIEPEKFLKEETLEKYLPWSKELPVDIRNYTGTYKNLADTLRQK